MLDLIIRGGSVLDGSGADAFTADIGVKDGKIAAIGSFDGTAGTEIDAGDFKPVIFAKNFRQIFAEFFATIRQNICFGTVRICRMCKQTHIVTDL